MKRGRHSNMLDDLEDTLKELLRHDSDLHRRIDAVRETINLVQESTAELIPKTRRPQIEVEAEAETEEAETVPMPTLSEKIVLQKGGKKGVNFGDAIVQVANSPGFPNPFDIDDLKTRLRCDTPTFWNTSVYTLLTRLVKEKRLRKISPGRYAPTARR
jgi:hypothetical protein